MPLSFPGLPPHCLLLPSSFFPNSRGGKSSTKSINDGVPQGKCSRASYFYHIQERFVNISDHNIRMFADDAVLFDVFDGLPALYNKFNRTFLI